MDGDEVAIVRNVTLGYAGKPAVRNVTFSMGVGEFVCLIGPNGCGKSTLLKGMLGLLEPMSGAIELPVGLGSTAFLPQTSEVGNFPATVWEVALSGCQGRGRGFWYTAADRELARRNLALMGVSDLASRRVGSLSGGQRQRVYLARCLCREPRLLLLDEPYAGLDREAAEGLSGILEGLRAQGIAVLMSSHDLDMVASCGGRVLALDDGLVFDGEAAEWLNRTGRDLSELRSRVRFADGYDHTALRRGK